MLLGEGGRLVPGPPSPSSPTVASAVGWVRPPAPPTVASAVGGVRPPSPTVALAVGGWGRHGTVRYGTVQVKKK